MVPAFARTLIVSVVGTSMLLVGVMESVFAEIAQPGMARTQPTDLDAAGCVRSDAEADVDGEQVDAGADRHDHAWHNSGPMPAAVLQPAFSGSIAAPAKTVALSGCRAAALIRGPPARS